jgi:hypothetical protein
VLVCVTVRAWRVPGTVSDRLRTDYFCNLNGLDAPRKVLEVAVLLASRGFSIKSASPTVTFPSCQAVSLGLVTRPARHCHDYSSSLTLTSRANSRPGAGVPATTARDSSNCYGARTARAAACSASCRGLVPALSRCSRGPSGPVAQSLRVQVQSAA